MPLQPPNQSLPSKVINAIIDEVAIAGDGPWRGPNKDLVSCCMASKIFVEACQKHIFNSVILHPQRIVLRYSDVRTSDRTRLFCRLIKGSPHIAQYVQSLTYFVTMRDMYDDDLIQALEALVNIRYLHLQFGSADWDVESEELVYKDADSSQPTTWVGSMVAIATNPGLESLSLCNTGFFIEASRFPTSLKSVSIDVTPSPVINQYCATNFSLLPKVTRPTELICLQSLTIGAMFTENMTYLMHSSRQLEELTAFRQLTHLDVTLFPMEDFHNISDLLQSLEILKNLVVRTWCVAASDEAHIPFYDLNPLSFATLSSVTVEAHFLCENADGGIIPDPYLGLDVLLNQSLGALEELSVLIRIAAWEGISTLTFGHQWSMLNDRIPQAVASGDLRKLNVYVFLEDVEDEDPLYDVDSVHAAHQIEELLYPTYFKDLIHFVSVDSSVQFDWKVYG